MRPNDLVNTKTTIPFRVGEQRLIYTLTLRVSIYIYPHHYSLPLRGTVVYYSSYPPSFHALVFKSDGVGVVVVITIKRRTLRSSENSVLILLIPLTTPSFTIN